MSVTQGQRRILKGGAAYRGGAVRFFGRLCSVADLPRAKHLELATRGLVDRINSVVIHPSLRALDIISWYTRCGTVVRGIDYSTRGLDGDPRRPSSHTAM